MAVAVFSTAAVLHWYHSSIIVELTAHRLSSFSLEETKKPTMKNLLNRIETMKTLKPSQIIQTFKLEFKHSLINP